MWRRSILIAAAVAASLTFSAVDVSAQGQGEAQSAEVRQNGSMPTSGRVVTELPPGIQQQVDNGREVAPGIDRRYEAPVAPFVEPAAEPEPEPEPEPCATTVVMVGLQLYIVDCHGNMFPL